ncbi:unnamed protein product [[Candida] boidinii]|uniref:Unnamed protein product n=1 Tax=Candida boidinii TaxID=5477 RepID=A0A9W6WJ24_CANBO|nr:hypothetical protein B5S30_g4252 [[Candida] boidinii]OWB86244.1 hypothetical protein B5S33_g4928 [[Candida] boidinii]GME74744.1 unnamed protein product [[Candida] boidinii]GMF99867.1 unnamed protein product [[Candida] boidinii]
MALTKKEFSIITLLVIDTIFFFIEIIVGYAVNSLALIADSFHMLNDIISLLVALWAVNVAKNRVADSKYTYGWQRAEILGALINAVFLLALCFTIFIEAVQRFIIPQEISNPKLILFVGTCGLISNIAGLFLFHEHGHSHGGGGGEGALESGHGHSHGHSHSHADSDIPQAIESSEHCHSHSDGHSHSENTPLLTQSSKDYNTTSSHASSSNLVLHDEGLESSTSVYMDDPSIKNVLPSYVVESIERGNSKKYSRPLPGSTPGSWLVNHGSHNHVIKKDQDSKSHSKSLNMHGVFLHVLGDALGNVGVMATALFIWKTNFKWRFYTDPLISLVITCIIFSSALPLCKSSSRILLQGSPTSVDLEDIKDDIVKIPGVVSVHEFHIWNLTEKLLIASLHVDLNTSPENFIEVAQVVKQCLHAYGIHSATIQPEFTQYYAKKNAVLKRYSSSNILPDVPHTQQHSHNTQNNNLISNSNSSSLTDIPNTQQQQQQSHESEPHSTHAHDLDNQHPHPHAKENENSPTCLVDESVGCSADNCIR